LVSERQQSAKRRRYLVKSLRKETRSAVPTARVVTTEKRQEHPSQCPQHTFQRSLQQWSSAYHGGHSEGEKSERSWVSDCHDGSYFLLIWVWWMNSAESFGLVFYERRADGRCEAAFALLWHQHERDGGDETRTGPKSEPGSSFFFLGVNRRSTRHEVPTMGHARVHTIQH